jgi:transposase-like protein
MTDDDTDICGHPTASGGPCQHPATDGDSCWLNEHGGDAAPSGRPPTLEEYEDDILRGAQQGMTLQGCARLAGVDESTLHRWIQKYDEFCKSLKRARAHGELQHLRSVNESGSRFILERSFGYTKTEKRELEHSGDGVEIVADFSTDE